VRLAWHESCVSSEEKGPRKEKRHPRVHHFARTEVAPHVQENDAKKYFDRSILKKISELDILGICIPEKYGGAGMDYISLGLACEELEYVDTSLRVILSVHMGMNSLTLLS